MTFFFRSRNSCWWGQPPFPPPWLCSPSLVTLAAGVKPSETAVHHGWCGITKNDWTQCFCVKRIKSLGSFLQIKEHESYILSTLLCQTFFLSISINIWHKDFWIQNYPCDPSRKMSTALFQTLENTRGSLRTEANTDIIQVLLVRINLALATNPMRQILLRYVLLMKKMHIEM